MPWNVKDGILEDPNSYVIGSFSPDINPYYIKLIRKTPEIINALTDYLKAYESSQEGPRKKISRKLHDEILNLIDPTKNYDFEWELDANGDLVEESGRKLFFFLDKNLPEPVLMKFIPNILKAIKEELPLTGTNGKQKPLYQKFTMIYSQIAEY